MSTYYTPQPEEHTESVGAILRYERERRRYTLDKIAEELQIKKEYLERIEEDAIGELPADIYTRNYIKRFAEFVKVNPSEVLKLYDKQRHVYDVTHREARAVFSKKKKRLFSFIVTPKIVRRFFISLIFFAFAFYVWFQISDLSSAPEVIILEPSSAEITTVDDSLQVVGSVSSDAVLTINGKQIKLTSEGAFQENIELQQGSNALLFKAENKFGKKTEVSKKVFVE